MPSYIRPIGHRVDIQDHQHLEFFSFGVVYTLANAGAHAHVCIYMYRLEVEVGCLSSITDYFIFFIIISFVMYKCFPA